MWDELAHQVNWDAVTSKTTLVSEVKGALPQMLYLKVVRLGLIDCLKAKKITSKSTFVENRKTIHLKMNLVRTS